jgi:type II secretory pathway component PulF
MLLSSRLPLSNLIELSRVSRHYLGAGLGLTDVFRQQANKGAIAVRPIAGRIATALEQGDSLERALDREQSAFPPLFLALTHVGEQTGMLPEVFHELERYYLRQQKLWRHFLGQIAWPVVQFFLAVFVLAGLILIMGMLADVQGPGSKPLDPLGIGLAGPTGATIFLAVVFGTLFALAAAYWVATRTLQRKAAVNAFLLRVPALGPCLRALALARFCMALRLTTETGMSVMKAMRLSLRATGDEAFVAQGDTIEKVIRKGDDLTTALTRTGLFPQEFLHIIAVAEESGKLSDVLQHQAEHYNEESGRRLAVLTAVAGYGVWALIGIIIIVAIFRIFSWYVGMLG